MSESDPLVRVEVPAPHPSRPDEPVDGVALVTFERPAAFNALSFELLAQLAAVLERIDADPAVRCVVLTGGGTRAFAAGADIKELAAQTPLSILEGDGFGAWARIDRIGLPIVAAVRGYALGGGCELAMACDMIVAGDDAVFGQPEIDLGIIPGAGGTQRLVRAVGKARAMELILTGRRLDAAEAERIGLVTTVVPAERTLEVALELAGRIATKAPLAVRAAKQAVLAAYEGPLADGIADERRRFAALFGTDDQAEGMAAFAEKRPPSWKGR